MDHLHRRACVRALSSLADGTILTALSWVLGTFYQLQSHCRLCDLPAPSGLTAKVRGSSVLLGLLLLQLMAITQTFVYSVPAG